MTDEQTLVADSAACFLAEAAAMPRVRHFAEGAEPLDRSLWQGLVEQGWCGLPWPEDLGGSGLGWPELVLLGEQLGRRLAPVPFLDSVALAGSLLHVLAPACAGAESVLKRISVGQCIAVAVLDVPELARWTPDALSGTGADTGQLEGRWPLVHWAESADVLLLPAWETAGEAARVPVLLAVPADTAGLQRERVRSVDQTRRMADVHARGLRLPTAAVLARGPQMLAAVEWARDLAAIALAAEQVGVAAQCLDLSVAYTQQRHQFGQPVAAFQAVKHRCAQMLVALEGARSAVWSAAIAAETARRPILEGRAPTPADRQVLGLAAAQARCDATEAAQFNSAEAIQLHGGVGYTWEYDPQLYFKRAQADSQRLRPLSWWRERVAAQRVSRAPDAGSTVPCAAPGEPLAAFRAEVLQWVESHLQGEFAALRHAHGPGVPGFDAALARRWEQTLARAGWTGLAWPREMGGRALPLAWQLAFHEAYTLAGGPGRLGHIGETLLAPTLIEHGTAQQQARFLPGILAGQTFWAQGYSEPGAGSDLANVRTRAAPDPVTGEWVIHGQKVWTSWAHESDWIFVLARTDPDAQRHRGLTLLLVPLNQPGITIRPIRQMTGSAEFNEVFFDAARTEASLHLGAVGQGWSVAMSLLGHERGASTLGQQAHFQHELDLVLKVARAHGAAEDPVLRQRLAQSVLGLATLRSHALRVLAAPAGQPLSAAAMTSKYAWSNWRRDLGRLAMDVLGGEAERRTDSDPDRQRLHQLWLSSRADTIYAGTNEIQLNLMAERGLGMPR